MSAKRATKQSNAKIRSYAEAEAHLLSLVNYETKPPPMTDDEEGWHLHEFRAFLNKLGSPQDGLPIIHVAGTKGKGSTTRILCALLRASGCRRVGAFTSPHLESFRERISINDKPISSRDFIDVLETVRAMQPERKGEGFRTTFETLTAMAFLHFKRRQCDAVVLECGLGGRLDCTNVVAARVALITTIGWDHQRVLGNTLRAIAREKAGIITPAAARAVVGPQFTRRRQIVARAARAQTDTAKIPLEFCDFEPDPIRNVRVVPWGFDLDLALEDWTAENVHFPVMGRHQLDNLRAALIALRAFSQAEGGALSAARARKSLEALTLPGRLEPVVRSPVALVDGAHCPASARAAARALSEHFPGRPVALVLGALNDKNHRALLAELARGAPVARVLTYRPDNPRALDAQQLASLAREHFPKVEACATLEEAMEKAAAHQRRHPETVILATGSNYGIGPARRAALELLGAPEE